MDIKIKVYFNKIIKTVLITFLIISNLIVIIYRFVNPPSTFTIWSERNNAKSKEWTTKQRGNWIKLEEISYNMKHAAIISEDRLFFNHKGFDFIAIQKAYHANKQSGKLFGASTISQQTAKNVFLWQGRSWFRKSLEVYFTILIENYWSKERILEVYLNVIETGDGIFGVEAAAKLYFNKSCKELKGFEAALIAACFPSPKIMTPFIKPETINLRQRKILKNMQRFKNLYMNTS